MNENLGLCKKCLLLFVIILEVKIQMVEESCMTPRQESGTCKGAGECPPILQIFKNKNRTEEEGNYVFGCYCGHLKRTLYVCCANVVQSESTDSRSTSEKEEDSTLPSFDQCGASPTDSFYGRTVTKVNEFPWHGLIQYTDNQRVGRKMFACGSSLINRRYVITAANCVRSKDIPQRYEPTAVRLGDWDTSTDPDCDTSQSPLDCVDQPVQDIIIAEIIVHKRFRNTDKNNNHNIALIRLRDPAIFNFYVKPICLPTTVELQQKNLEGSTAIVAGLGFTELGRIVVKHKDNQTVTSNTICQQNYSSISRHIILADTQLCAGGQNGEVSCVGLSGDPLMSILRTEEKHAPTFYLIGLVSHGASDCSSVGLPSVYTRVTQYMGWILEKIRAG